MRISTKRWTVRAAVALASGALAAGVMGAAVPAGAAPPVAPMSAPADSDRAARYEVDFLTEMIDHHHMAVTSRSRSCAQ